MCGLQWQDFPCLSKFGYRSTPYFDILRRFLPLQIHSQRWNREVVVYLGVFGVAGFLGDLAVHYCFDGCGELAICFHTSLWYPSEILASSDPLSTLKYEGWFSRLCFFERLWKGRSHLVLQANLVWIVVGFWSLFGFHFHLGFKLFEGFIWRFIL